jgi:hypothetical protein
VASKTGIYLILTQQRADCHRLSRFITMTLLLDQQWMLLATLAGMFSCAVVPPPARDAHKELIRFIL